MNRKRVLIVRLSSLGDVIFNLPLASVLKKAGYYVAWITGEKGIDVIKNNPLVDDAILVPTGKWKKQPFYKTFNEYLTIIKYIRSKKFDIVIDTQLLLKSFIWIAFSGAKRRIVSKGAREFSVLGGNEFIEPLSTDKSSHAIKNYLKYAEYLGLNVADYEVDLPVSPPETVDKVNNLLKMKTDKPLVAICPATTWIPKHWAKDNWRVLVKLLDSDYNLIFLGTKNDSVLIDYISDGIGLNLSGSTSVLDLIEIFRRVDLVLSLDNGCAHLAWATKHPKIITIFCCTPEYLYAPLGDSKKYISVSGNLRCQPCHQRVCKLKTSRNCCTMRPTAQEVYLKVQEILPVKNKKVRS